MELLPDAFARGLSYAPGIDRAAEFESLWDYQPFEELMRAAG